MKIRRHAFKFYGRFSAAYGTLWLAMLLVAWVTRSSINAGIYGLFGFPALALFYATVRAFTDAKLGNDIVEAKPRFSLRGLLVVIAFAALLLAWWRDHWHLAELEFVTPSLLEESRARVEQEADTLQRMANLLHAPIAYERGEGVSSEKFGSFYYVSTVELPTVTITDEQIGPLIQHLSNLPRLRDVDVGEPSPVSPAQLEKLRAALPNADFGRRVWPSRGPKGYPDKVYPTDGNSPSR